MKIKLLAVLSFLFFTQNIFSQNKTTSLKIFLKSAKNDSIPNASLQLLHLPDSTLVATQLYNPNGNSFTVKCYSKYLIQFSCIGFESINKPIHISDKAFSTTLLLKRSESALQNVVVVSKRTQLITQENDKTIVDAAPLANSSSNAYEVLQKTPGAVVDQDGNVYLSSMSPATILINGREMKLSPADLTSLLKSLPAGSISKIEILRNPSAKYDAESSGGIVNIVLKKGVKLGSNGSVNIGYFQGVYSTKTVGFNFNKSAGKINSYFSYQFTNRNNFETLNTSRFVQSDSTLLKQNSYTTYPSENNYFSGGIDYAITKKFNLSYDVRLNNTGSKSNALSAYNISNDITQQLSGLNQSDIYNQNHSLYLSNNFSTKYKIDSVGSEWTSEFDYNYYLSNNSQNYTNTYSFPLSPTVIGDGQTNSYKNMYTFKSDLILKLPKKTLLEAGIKTNFSFSKNAAVYYDQEDSIRQLNLYQTNTYKYSEAISAAYLQVSKTFYGFTLKPGLRLETTNINGHQTFPYDTTLSIKRADFFPYVFVQHKLFKMFHTQITGNAIYRRSIKRPYYEILNPYPKYDDQYLYDVGNPKLQPQFTTNYELNATFNNFPVFAVGKNLTSNIFSNVTIQNDSTKIAYRTWANLGTNTEYYFRLIAGIPPGGKYFFYVGAQYNYNLYDGTYQNVPLHFSRESWLFFMNQEYKITHTLTLNMQGFMRIHGLQNLYELKTFGGLYLAANKSILDKKANIILSLNDALYTNPVTFNLNQGGIDASGTRKNDTRKIGITFRYNFGLSKPKEDKEFGAPVEGKEN